MGQCKSKVKTLDDEEVGSKEVEHRTKKSSKKKWRRSRAYSVDGSEDVGLQSRFGSESNVCPENKARSSAVLLSYSLKRHAEISDAVVKPVQTKDLGDEDNPRLNLSTAICEDIPFSLDRVLSRSQVGDHDSVSGYEVRNENLLLGSGNHDQEDVSRKRVCSQEDMPASVTQERLMINRSSASPALIHARQHKDIYKHDSKPSIVPAPSVTFLVNQKGRTIIRFL